MNKPGVKHLIIFCCVILIILASITTWVLVNDRSFNDFYLNIYEVDKNINSGFFIQASEQLDTLYDDIFNTRTVLIFLKRADKIASATEDFSKFADYSERIYKKYNSSVEIAAVCAYALQMNLDYKKALRISEDKLGKSVYKNIYLLNIIENNIVIDDLKIIENFKNDYEFLFADSYTPEMLSSAAERHWDERYIVDEALLLLKAGEIAAANVKLLETKNTSFQELKMFASLDNLNYSKAEEYFHQLKFIKTDLSEQVLFTGCDILMHNGKNNEASDLYASYIAENPDVYSLPYRNLYSINRRNVSAINWLSMGLSYFPESTELLIPAAWMLYLNNNFEELKQTIVQLEATDNDTISELFKLNTMLAGRNPEHIISNYWNVFNSDPESENVAISFANYLLQNRQYQQLSLLVQKYLRSNRPADWVYQYSAIGRVIKGDVDQALKDIDIAINISENYMSTYNKAVILEISGYPEEALEYYLKALEKADHEEIKSNNLSKIYFKLAEKNYNKNSFKDAYHYIRMAIDIDPDNMKNKLILRKIKEEYND